MVMEDPIMSLKNVSVSYRRRSGFLRWSRYWALEDVSFNLYHGETLGVVGKNGAGKSTLLRVMAGIIAADRGVIDRGGCTVSLLSLQVGFIPHLSGRQNAILSGMLLGMSRKYVEKKMNQIIAFSGLEDFIDEPVRTYSTGMCARLGFSVSIQMDPDVILVDEVLGVGDAEFREKSSKALREKISSNKTVVIVSHDEGTLRELCDRVLWIDGKENNNVGDVDSVLASYNSSYVDKKN